jgi:hypothetical protein
MARIVSPYFDKPQGYLLVTDPDPTKSKGQRATAEFITQTCGHCGSLVRVDLSAPEPPTELCYGCRRNICKSCVQERATTMRCDVIENKLERWEARDRLRRDIGG